MDVVEHKKNVAFETEIKNKDSEDKMFDILFTLNATFHPLYPKYKENLEIAKRTNVAWVPIGLVDHSVRQFHKVLSRCYYIVNPIKLREMQLPLSDMNIMRISQLPLQERSVASLFFEKRNRKYLGIGQVHLKRSNVIDKCHRCFANIEARDFFVTIMEQHNRSALFCVKCFHCTTCKQMLVDFIYFLHGDKLYCLRHFAEKYFKRCGSCDELIFSRELIKTKAKYYHKQHFICSLCEKCVADKKYVIKNNEIICINCYDKKCGNICEECKELISHVNPIVTHDEEYWHEECFFCHCCEESLVDQTFVKDDAAHFCLDCSAHTKTDKCPKKLLSSSISEDTSESAIHLTEEKIEPPEVFDRVNVNHHVDNHQEKAELNDSKQFGGDTSSLTTKAILLRGNNACKETTESLIENLANNVCIVKSSEMEESFMKNLSCLRCQKPIQTQNSNSHEEVEILNENCYHSACFTCFICHISLDKNSYENYSNDIVCQRCFSAIKNLPFLLFSNEKEESSDLIDIQEEEEYTTSKTPVNDVNRNKNVVNNVMMFNPKTSREEKVIKKMTTQKGDHLYNNNNNNNNNNNHYQ